ncbi:hypothetical protein VTK73DRAFT_5574 [Phialemonium thermophilum]|uniref:protein-ribulosamine 3-kinase n=1 Tax=Phialemonium thermophilum TaxID=223376 RepID=A0ABR3XX36_9PEZI
MGSYGHGDVSKLDPNVLNALSDVSEVLGVTYHGESAWAQAMRIDVLHADGNTESYFMKVSVGPHGRESLKGEFEATAAIHSATPDFCPKPIACGTFQDEPDTHFYICKFYNFTEGLPEPQSFCANLARLHSHTNPSGQFGFHCTTYNGDLPQDNTWNDSWESFFANGLRHILKIREERAGPCPELDALLPGLFEKVIPRLLRPLETGGRKVKPSLVHGDLWCGNAAIVDENTEEGIIFDPASFWAHNEYELGNWRPERNKFTKQYFDEYHSHIPRAEPSEDYDGRNALYALRFNLHAASLFPKTTEFLKMAIDEIDRLSKLYPDGYVGEENSLSGEKNPLNVEENQLNGKENLVNGEESREEDPSDGEEKLASREDNLAKEENLGREESLGREGDLGRVEKLSREDNLGKEEDLSREENLGREENLAEEEDLSREENLRNGKDNLRKEEDLRREDNLSKEESLDREESLAREEDPGREENLRNAEEDLSKEAHLSRGENLGNIEEHLSKEENLGREDNMGNGAENLGIGQGNLSNRD